MRKKPASKARSRRRAYRVCGVVFVFLFLVLGLYLGAESTLTLTRAADGRVTAVNAWRFAGKVTLLSRTVTGLREVKLQRPNQADYRSTSGLGSGGYGRQRLPDEMVLIGDSTMHYPYHDDLSLIRNFLGNTANKAAVLTHPLDVRRQVASWLFLALAVLSIAGFVVTIALGRDPLAGSARKVKPLPPAVSGVVVLGAFVACIWFFLSGHHVFGSVATAKVRLLMESAKQNDAAGVERAIAKGVFIDVRDGQSMTALMYAARAGALQAMDALLKGGANPGLRDLGDRTALVSAIEMRQRKVALRLLAAGTDVDSADSNGRTALHLAAELGDAVLVQRLLQNGAKTNEPDAHGWTPLMFAASSGHTDAANVLLAAGADPRLKLPDGRTAANLVTSDAALRELLLKAGGKQ